MTRDESLSVLYALLEDAVKRLADMQSLPDSAFEGGAPAKTRIIRTQASSIAAIRQALTERGVLASSGGQVFE